MTISVTHTFVNPISDVAGGSGTKPSHWNAEHSISGIEPSLGNPDVNGKVLASTTGGTRSWVALPAAGGGGAYPLQALSFDPADSLNYFFGILPMVPSNYIEDRAVYLRTAGTLSVVELLVWVTGAASSENVSFYYKKDTGADQLIATVNLNNSVTGLPIIVSNTSLSDAISVGQRLNFKMVSPAWTTNPTGVVIGGYFII